MKMNSTIKQVLTFVSGAVIGAGLTYIILNKQFNARVDEEVESVKEYARRKIEESQVKEINMSSTTEKTTDEILEHMPTPSYKHHDILDQDDEFDDEIDEDKWAEYNNPNDRMKMPFIISPEDYSNTMLHFDKETLYFYEGDGVFADDQDEIIDDPSSLLGDAAQYFGYIPEDPDLVYVRNYRFATDYELCRAEGSYQETILGEYLDKKERRKSATKPSENASWDDDGEEDDGWD